MVVNLAYVNQEEYNALDLRRLDAFQLMSAQDDPLGAAGGIRPGHPVASLSGGIVTVHDMLAVVYPAITSRSGPYRVAHLSTDHAVPAADATNPRIDGIDIQVQDDDEDLSGQRQAISVYVTGNPGSGSGPATSPNAIRVAEVTVPADGGGSPTVSATARYQVSNGGILPVRDDTERPSAGLYDGLVVARQDTGKLEMRYGGAWVDVNPDVSDVPRVISTGDAGSNPGLNGLIQAITPGKWSNIRLMCWGESEGNAPLRIRLNNITGDDYFSAYTGKNADGTDATSFFSSTANALYIGEWNGSNGCGAVIDLLSINGGAQPVVMARLYALSGTAGSHTIWDGYGTAHSVLQVDNIHVQCGPGFRQFRWAMIGYPA